MRNRPGLYLRPGRLFVGDASPGHSRAGPVNLNELRSYRTVSPPPIGASRAWSFPPAARGRSRGSFVPPSVFALPVSLLSWLSSFRTRAVGTEWMDDPNVEGAALRTALRDLRRINRLLGGLRASTSVLAPMLAARRSLHVLDVGSGTGDYLAHFARLGAGRGVRVRATGIDLNPRTVGHGRAWLDATLPPALRPAAALEVGDALDLPYPDDAVDVAHAALFLHHFHGDAAVRLLREMDRVSRHGILVNDLHRHPLAYLGIWALSRAASFSPMVQHDGPLSVRRGFRRADLQALAGAAGLPSAEVRWHWAFRWTLSSLGGGQPPSRPGITAP